MASSGRPRRSVTKPLQDKHQTTLKKFFHVVSKDEEQEKCKAIIGNESGSDSKEDLKEHEKENEGEKENKGQKENEGEKEKENEGDTKDDGYVKVFRK
jgi:hypothetical protein